MDFSFLSVLPTVIELERKTLSALLDDDFELAVDLFSEAIEISPNDSELFVCRAQVHIKLHNYIDAVADADKAIQLDPSSARAYLQKGIACFKLEEYQTAKVALEKGVAFAQNDPRFAKLIEECNNCIAETVVNNAEVALAAADSVGAGG